MQEQSARRSNKDRSEDMRARLMAAARALFVEKGFAETGTPEIVRDAKVTRGALYHHFADKTDLFRAIVRAEADAIGEEIENSSASSASAVAALRDGTRAYFQAMQVAGRVRLLLLDGPAVLGFGEMAAIDAQHDGATLRAGLAEALAGTDTPLDAMADVLSAGFERAAIAIAGGAPPAPYLDALLILVETLAGTSEAD